MSKVNDEDPEAWVAAVDTRKKTLEALAPFSAERFFCYTANHRPCAFSKYLGRAEQISETKTCLFVNYRVAWFVLFVDQVVGVVSVLVYRHMNSFRRTVSTHANLLLICSWLFYVLWDKSVTITSSLVLLISLSLPY